MEISIKILCGIVALEHFYFMYLEMFLWTKPFGRKTFGNSVEFANSSKILAANQGLYNGFLAVGLLWSFFISDAFYANEVRIFFLACVFIAGLYGGYSVSKRIFLIQGVPAGIALVLLAIS